MSGTWVFVVGWILLPAGLGALWWWTLAFSTGARLPLAGLMVTQGMAWAGRYMPGKAGLVIAKLTVAREAGTSWRLLGRTVLAEQILFIIAGLCFAFVFLPFDAQWLHRLGDSWLSGSMLSSLSEGNQWFWRSLAIALLVGGGWLALAVSTRMLSLPRLQTTRLKWALVLCGHFLLHLLVGLAVYPLLSAMLPIAAGELGVLGVAAVFALANCAGILAIIAPAGLGVREAVLALCLSHGAGFDAALAVAAWVRVLTLIADGAFSGLAISAGWLLGRKNAAVEGPDQS
ncbi:MAG: hypothetical protein U5L08_08740 [Xanthomonadales bacterium]|nr:hypothetical protein [Xanthomonadales bacterium]